MASKYTIIEEPVFITDISTQPSKNSTGDIYKITFKGIQSQEDYHTYVDPSYANYAHWRDIIKQHSADKGQVLTRVKLKDDLKRLVNADSEPRLEYMVTRVELAEALAEYWNTLGYRNWFG